MKPDMQKDMSSIKGERIAKVLARAGVASRRDAEKLIEEGRIKVNGKTLKTPAVKVTDKDTILFDDNPIADKEPPRLWRYHKPSGLVTTHKDEQGRQTVFQHLPKDIGRVISVGRLDITSEGLLLLTNDGELARALELPSTGWARRYRARAFGSVTQEQLDTLKAGIKIDGYKTGPIEATLDKVQGGNVWVTVTIREGKNREVRNALETVGLKVNRLIRTTYGPFQLGTLEGGKVEEVKNKVLRDQVGHLVEIPKNRPPQKAAIPAPKRGTHASAKRFSKDGDKSDKPEPQGRGKFAKGGKSNKTKSDRPKLNRTKHSGSQSSKPGGSKPSPSKPSASKPKPSRPRTSKPKTHK